MKIIIPTFKVRCSLRAECTVGGEKYLPGRIVELPYGVALQGIARGVVGAIEDAETAHAQAFELLGIYGADAWFPAHMQTLGKVTALMAEAEQEAQTATKH